jgi:hypothetical protein
MASTPRRPARMEYSVGPAKSALGSILAETSPRGDEFKAHDVPMPLDCRSERLSGERKYIRLHTLLRRSPALACGLDRRKTTLENNERFLIWRPIRLKARLGAALTFCGSPSGSEGRACLFCIARNDG